MVIENGVVLVCDRCGKTVLFENGKDEIDENSGWTKANGKELCPKCSEDFGRILKVFWSKK